jgi:hypothetical protein
MPSPSVRPAVASLSLGKVRYNTILVPCIRARNINPCFAVSTKHQNFVCPFHLLLFAVAPCQNAP